MRRFPRWLGFVALMLIAPPSHPLPVQAMPTASDTLFVLSTNDLKGKCLPCGCRTPKGGLARQAGFEDSMRTHYANVMVVDAGGFCPEESDRRERAAFMILALSQLGVEAATVSERDLRYGYAWLEVECRRAGLPIVCANLIDTRSGRPAFETGRVQDIHGVAVGVFGLISPDADLGPAGDTLQVLDPIAAARAMVTELHRRGARVIVALSQLGRPMSEELAANVTGIDAMIVGRYVPMEAWGTRVGSAVLSFGGEQGHYMGRTALALDEEGRATSGHNEMVMMGPGMSEDPTVLARVKRFEDADVELQRTWGFATPSPHGGSRFVDSHPR